LGTALTAELKAAALEAGMGEGDPDLGGGPGH